MSPQQVRLTPGWNDTHSPAALHLRNCLTDVCLGFTSSVFNAINATSVHSKGMNEKHEDLTSCRRRWEGPQNSLGPSTVIYPY